MYVDHLERKRYNYIYTQEFGRAEIERHWPWFGLGISRLCLIL